MSYSFPREGGGIYGVPPAASDPIMPASIYIPGTDSLPVVGAWAEQSNARALHNIQVDPSDPNKIHAVITGMTDVSGNDINSVSRRAFYTYSSDGGKHWTTPVALGKLRSGYADMVLYKRGSEWVPAIAAHVYWVYPGNDTEVVSALWIEKGHEGDGNFAECIASRRDMNGNLAQIIWPSIAVSADGQNVYMIASSYTQTTAGAEQLQFGVWNLSADTAVFQGWTAEPGAGDANNPGAGITQGGEYRIAVSQSGHIGVAWVNLVSGDGSIYFSESTDKGVTWSSTIPMIAMSGNQTDRILTPTGSPYTYSWTPGASIDFWYNGDTPQFIYVGVYDDPTDNFYLPYTTTLYFVKDANFADTIPIATADISGGPGAIPNIINIGGNDINFQTFPGMISWPTVGMTSTPGQYAVFYQTHLAGDTEVFTDDTGTVIFPYGSIFYSTTMDGGQTWSDPTPFMVNDPSASQKYDFRFPQVSTMNPTGTSGIVYNAMFSVDSNAGFVDSAKSLAAGSVPGFDIISYAYATTAPLSGVTGGEAPASLLVAPSYPNPFASSTNITFTLPSESTVLLTVSDMLGRTVATLATGRMGAGEHTVMFNGGDLPNGVYRYTLRANGESVTKSMSLLR